MSQSQKPQIKLKIGGAASGSARSPSLGTPTIPLPTPTGGPKIRLSMSGVSKPSTPNEPAPPPQKTKAGRAPKPSAKAAANKNGKRTQEDSEDDLASTVTVIRKPPVEAYRAQSKKIKLSFGGPKTPTVLKAKFKGKPPKRSFGVGYDSEASDREEDPAIEEEFVLRMVPGDDCTYLRQMIEEKKIGLGRREGGADIQMKFLHPEGRRAVVTIRGRHYAATMVDLPAVIEGMKSWDRKGWYKSADICQMLWVFQQIPKESDAATIDLPKIIDQNTHQYPHGLTAPMRDARKRRFRKRISRTAIEAVEDAVEKLLEADGRAESTRYEMIDPEGSRHGSRSYSTASPGAYGNDEEQYSSNEEDAEGEEDDDTNNYFGHVNGNGHAELHAPPSEVDDLEADLEAALEADLEAEMDAGTPSSQVKVEAETPGALTNGGTPDATGNLQQDDSGDDSVEDDEDDDAEGEDDGVDEDERARVAQIQGVKEDIADMERQIGNLQAQLASQSNPILQRRIKDSIEKTKSELQLKKSAIGEGDEEN
jgi:transcription initiation factor TFIID subunit 7